MIQDKIIKRSVFFLTFFAALLISNDISAKSIYMGPNETYKTLNQAFLAMSSGDSLIIKDGTYTGEDNKISSSNHPPVGISKSQPTVIKAENTGKVFFDGENTRQMFQFNGKTGGTSYIEYWTFQGIQWIRSSAYGIEIYDGDHNDFTTGDYAAGGNLDSYLIFKNCGFHGEEISVQLGYCRYVLFEDCWTWGNGRYGYNFYLCDYIVVRRNVDRRDNLGSTGSHPSSSYMNYCSHYVEFQNCISINIDNNLWDDGATPSQSFKDPYGGFYARNSYNSRLTDDTHYRGCIVLDYDSSCPSDGSSGQAGWYVQTDPTDTSLDHCIVWGSSTGIVVNNVSDNVDINHCVVGGADNQAGFLTTIGIGENNGSSGTIVTDSAVVNCSYMTAFPNYDSSSNYNGAYGNDSNTMYGSKDVTTDPGYQYIIRIGTGSDYDGAASDGGDIGATVLYKYGIDGTFYGDTGYNTLTNDKLWPWPNEDVIKTAFRNNYGTTDETRGFCADGMTLTKYIWEYLRNPIPSEIYGEPGENKAPLANAGDDQTIMDMDSNGSEQVSLNGSLSYDIDGTIIGYVWKENGQEIATGVNPNIDLTLGEHSIVLIVTDDEGAESSDTVSITINPYTNTIEKKVNFQPDGATIPQGYLVDEGLLYDEGRGYGWKVNVPSNYFRERDVQSDQRLDTFVFSDDNLWTWEMAIPSGQYYVTLSVGDPDHARGNHKVIIESEEVINASTQANQFIVIENHPVSVLDGKLTVQIGGGTPIGGEDPWGLTCLDYIVVKSSADSTPPRDVTNPHKVSLVENSLTLGWTNPKSEENGEPIPENQDFQGVLIQYNVGADAPYPATHNNGESFGDKLGNLDQDDSFTGTIIFGQVYKFSFFSHDADGHFSSTAHLTVDTTSANSSPTISNFTATPSSLNNPGESTTFNVSATDPDGDSLAYTINFGDGTANGSGSHVVHTYEAGVGEPPYIYTATVTVSDGNGNTVAESLQVPVNDIRPAEPTNVSAN